MNATPKTIQIFLPGGDPTGIRVAEITTRIVQVVDVPRKLLPDFFAMAESKHVGVYYLVAVPEDGGEPQVYIGQTGDLCVRLKEHDSDSKKEFWERALVLISRTQTLTQTHALFLEWLSIQATRKAARYKDSNGNGGSRPFTPAPMEADCHEIFETGKALLATLGHPLFTPIGPGAADAQATEVFYCTAGGTNARGVYTTEGLVVLAGSVGRRENVQSIVGTSDANFREKLISDGVMKIDGPTVVFTKDYQFRSPSTAAVAVLGRTANGWLEWKNEAGKTLDAVKRQAIGA